MKKTLLTLSLLIILLFGVSAQTTISTSNNTTGYTGQGTFVGNSFVTFNVENTNSTPIIFNEIELFKGAVYPLDNAKFTLWMSKTSLSGELIIVKPDWDSLLTVQPINLQASSYNKIFKDINILIPANTQYRFAIQSNGGIAFSGNFIGACSPSRLSANGVNLNLGEDSLNGQPVGITGLFPGGPNSSLYPRWFTGSITFINATPCIGTPVAGNTESSVTQSCNGVPFILSVPGATLGLNIKYQWDSSVNGTNWFPMLGDTSRRIIQSQTSNISYRCRVSCGSNTSTSVPVFITTPAPVSGTYTINGLVATGGTNFKTFNDAINHIKCGINGPITFNVISNSGPFDEQVTIPQIPGASSINKVVFNCNGETLLNSNTSAGNKSVLNLDGADYVTIDSLVVDATNGTFSWGIVLSNDANYNIITKCNVNCNAISSSLNYMGILINGNVVNTNASGANGSYNQIIDNKIVGGYFSIYVNGDNLNPMLNVNNVIKNNKISEFYATAVYAVTQGSGLIIEGNDISRPSRTNSTQIPTGIFIGSRCQGVLVQNNSIHDINAAMTNTNVGLTAISMNGNGKAGAENRVINNIIYNCASNGTYYGLFSSTSDTTLFYHNTVVFDDNVANTGVTHGFFQTGLSNGIEIKNNIFYISRSGTATKRMLTFSNALSTISCNNNVYYFQPTPSANIAFGQIGGLNYTTYNDWLAGNGLGYDVQSIEADPQFVDVSTGDLTPTNPSINDLGINLGIAKDILGVNRGTSPDPGAYEFTSPPCTSPVVAGNVNVTNNVCNGATLPLALIGNSYGGGQTYLWQRSLNGTSGWTNVQNALTNPNIVTTQGVNYYYRCRVRCGNDSAFTPTQLVTTPALLSGTYTINGQQATGGGNFNTIQEAIDYISCGINGKVVFNIVPNTGPYTEQVVIPAIKGTSKNNTITINANNNILQHTVVNSSRRVALHLKGIDNLIIDSLIVDVSNSTSMSWGILLSNQADSNVIKNSTVNISTSVMNTNTLGIILAGLNTNSSASGNNGNYNQFINNTINGGYAAFWLYGSNTSNIQNINNVVKNNKINDCSAFGVYAIHQSSGLIISGNEISRQNRTNAYSTYGINIAGNTTDALVEKNRIHNMFDQITNTSLALYAINVTSKGKAGKENKIINNLVYNIIHNGFQTGVSLGGADSTLVYHNTIVFDDLSSTSGTSWAFSQGGVAIGASFMNNISYITRTGTGQKRHFSFTSTQSKLTSNNNVVFGPVNFIGTWGNVNHATLNTWQNATGFDLQSQEFDPAFLVTGGGMNFLPNNPSINGIGANIGVLKDILDSNRTSSPDPGAFEVNISACANPPIPGASVTSSANICPNASFTLSLTGSTSGTGQTYWWERSSSLSTLQSGGGSTVGLPGLTPFVSATQSSTNYYRCKIQCSGGTIVYSTPVLVTTPSSVSGNYTVDNNAPVTATNFKNFTDALNFISCGGMGGPVNISAAPGSGPYNERIYIPNINGASATNTLKIFGNGVSLNYVAADVNNRTAITLDGAKYVTIENLDIDVSKGNFGWGILLTNQADNNTIRACNINANVAANSASFMGILINGSTSTANTSGNNGSNNLIEQNTISGGMNSILLYGNTNDATQCLNNKVINNRLEDFHANGVIANYMSENLLISKNDISRPNKINSTNAAGVYLNLGCMNALVEKNRIHGMFDQMQSNASAFNGIYIGSKARNSKPNKVFNNAIYDINSNGPTYGIYNASADTMLAYHNTIVFDNTNGTGSASIVGFYQNGTATGIDFRNNVISITRASLGIKRCLLFQTLTSSIRSNRNVLYLNSAGSNNGIGSFGNTVYPTLNQWKSANNNAWDSASVDNNPLFQNASTGDFMIKEALCRNIGRPIANITTDINDTIRNATTPDAGAFEYWTIVPIREIDFTGKNNNTFNALSWNTLGELNNKGFELQKSKNGIDFETISFIESKALNGNSSNKLYYQFNDMQPHSGNNYYRLKQVDIDGKFSYSKVVLIKVANMFSMQIFPNPSTNGIVNIKVEKLNGNATAIVTDLLGKSLHQQVINQPITTLNCKLNKGTYFITLLTKDGKEIRKLLVE